MMIGDIIGIKSLNQFFETRQVWCYTMRFLIRLLQVSSGSVNLDGTYGVYSTLSIPCHAPQKTKWPLIFDPYAQASSSNSRVRELNCFFTLLVRLEINKEKGIINYYLFHWFWSKFAWESVRFLLIILMLALWQDQRQPVG